MTHEISAPQPAPTVSAWIDINDRVPDVGTACLVVSQEPWEKAPSIKLDRWAEIHEAPVSFSSATVYVGDGWEDDHTGVTHWQPLPALPGAEPQAIPAPEGAQLPPLPKPAMVINEQSHDPAHRWNSYTAEQMHAYARAALAAPAPQAPAWQPIETAPKDGSLFLCWVMAVRYGETDEGQQYQEDVSQADFCHWQSHDDAPNGGWFEPCCGQIGDGQDVTQWMPLPAAPQTKEPTNDR